MKTNNRFELDPERLATTDEHGNRIYLHPEDVSGTWKNRRDIVYWFLIGLYLVLPWFYINGKPALMINLMKREFTFFGSTFYGVDPILFFLITIFLLFFIAALTSLLGRVWCGWGCPQTVFIQTIFLKIERLIEGSARERRALEEAPMNFSKFFKKAFKWILFALVSLHIAHTFIGYFIGPRELFYITLHSPLNNLGIFFATMIISGIFLLDFGWFREQFCIIACPYGRMQSVIMDENSLIIAYDAKRGEPRRGTPGVPRTDEGDCINCYNCVKVCPTGIDIRRGTQLECIACTNCIDACDEIMTKMQRPTGLIKYGSENELNGIKRKTITTRSVIYALISCFFISLFVIFINQSSNLDLIFIRGRETFTQDNEGITNRFTLKITHQGNKPYHLSLKLKDQEMAKVVKLIAPQFPLNLVEHEKKLIVFFKFPKSILVNGTKIVDIVLIDNSSDNINIINKEVVLVGPTE